MHTASGVSVPILFDEAYSLVSRVHAASGSRDESRLKLTLRTMSSASTGQPARVCRQLLDSDSTSRRGIGVRSAPISRKPRSRSTISRIWSSVSSPESSQSSSAVGIASAMAAAAPASSSSEENGWVSGGLDAVIGRAEPGRVPTRIRECAGARCGRASEPLARQALSYTTVVSKIPIYIHCTI